MEGINHWQIANIHCQSCGETTLQVNEIQGKTVKCAICHTEYAVIVHLDGRFSLLKIEG